MKITIKYSCNDCKTTFSAYCSVQDSIDNSTAGHGCGGTSKFIGSEGIYVWYMCGACGHMTKIDVRDIIPAMASRTHGCGQECRPA